MNNERRNWALFVENDLLPALKSGEYKQGRGALRTEEPFGSTFCCIGVACDLLVNQGDDRFAWGWQVGDEHVRTMLQTPGLLMEEMTMGVNSWTDFFPLDIADTFGVHRNPLVYRVRLDRRYSKGGYIEATSFASLNDEDTSGTFARVIEVLEKAVDPDNHEWFLTRDEAEEALSYEHADLQPA